MTLCQTKLCLGNNYFDLLFAIHPNTFYTDTFLLCLITCPEVINCCHKSEKTLNFFNEPVEKNITKHSHIAIKMGATVLY